MSEFSFPNIDTRYWNYKDSAWSTEREARWQEIEPMLANEQHKPRKALNIIRRYFLSGTMPDFEALADYNNEARHLDLLCFIWLHPSRDIKLLRKLRDEYVNSPLVTCEDVWWGLGGLIRSGTVTTSYDFCRSSSKDSQKSRLYTGENELLLDVLLGDLSNYKMPENRIGNWETGKFRSGYSELYSLGELLCLTKLNHINEDTLFQYDVYLNYWYLGIRNHEQPDKEKKKLTKPMYKKVLEEQLYRIYHFDIEREGDTCRTRAVVKFRKLFDEREMVPEFTAIWNDVKNGNVEIEDPWEY